MKIGLDLSITSPAAVLTSAGVLISAVCFSTKEVTVGKNVSVIPYVTPKTDFDREKRKDILLNGIINFISAYPNVDLMIEDYAFGANGRITELAEFCGIIKWEFRSRYQKKIAPTTLKKCVTGNGRATKLDMYTALNKNQKNEIFGSFNVIPNIKGTAPYSDLVDAYWLSCQ